MIEAARGRSRIVNGYELSYGYRDASAFRDARTAIARDAATLAADRAAYGRVVSAAFGLWLDYDWRKEGWHPEQPARNYFTPDGFEAALRAALEQSDDYVWIYSETPRWWSERGGLRRPADGLRRCDPPRPRGDGAGSSAGREVAYRGAMWRRITAADYEIRMS